MAFTPSVLIAGISGGHLFQGRYKAPLLQKGSHLLEAARYMALNPVRARLVKHPDDWPWSSYLATAGLVQCPEVLTCNWILVQFSDNLEHGCLRYRSFVRDRIDDERSGMTDHNPIFLGDEAFVGSIRERLRERQDHVEVPKRERFAGRPSLAAIFGPADSLTRTERREKIRDAVHQHGYTQKAIADYFKVHDSTVSR